MDRRTGYRAASNVSALASAEARGLGVGDDAFGPLGASDDVVPADVPELMHPASPPARRSRITSHASEECGERNDDGNDGSNISLSVQQ